jgi:hypothetical protein
MLCDIPALAAESKQLADCRKPTENRIPIWLKTNVEGKMRVPRISVAAVLAVTEAVQAVGESYFAIELANRMCGGKEGLVERGYRHINEYYKPWIDEWVGRLAFPGLLAFGEEEYAKTQKFMKESANN